MLVSPEDDFANASQQFLERHVTLNPSAQGKGIDEDTEHVLNLSPIPTRYRRPDDDIVLCGIAVQQRLKNRQKHHERSHFFNNAQALHGFTPRFRNLQWNAGTAISSDSASRAV